MYKKLLIILYITLILGVAYFFKSILEKHQLLQFGEKVEVLVLRVPNCDNQFRYLSNDNFLKFSFEGKPHIKRLKNKSCKILNEKYFRNKNYKIELITNKDRSYFLFPFEDFKIEALSVIFIELVFVYCFYRFLRSENRKRLSI